MTEIIRLGGTDEELYRRVAPLVMNPKVLKQNYNFPFRTSEHFSWLIALEGEKVIGFIPLEHRKSESVINNYYVKEKSQETLKLLIDRLITDFGNESPLTAISFLDDEELFREAGFEAEKRWTRYVKMKRELKKEQGHG